MPEFTSRTFHGAGIAVAGALALLVWSFWPGPARAGGDTLSGPVPARVESVVDGDTFNARAQIWLGQEVRVAVRLKGVNAPELHTSCSSERAKGEAARAFLIHLLENGDVILSDIREDKYGGRVDAVVTLPDGRDLSDTLLRAGYAVPYEGGKRVSLCAQG